MLNYFTNEKTDVDTKCRVCGKVYKDHTSKVKHDFVPMKYVIFNSDLDEEERDKITKDFNGV